MCFLAGPNVQQLHSSRCCAFSLSFQYPSSIIQSMSFCLCFPLPLFLSINPSIISLCTELCLRMCPIQFFCLVLIIFIKDLFSFTFFQYFFIHSVFCPADPLHPPPYSHLESLHAFNILFSHCPRLRSV